MSTIEDEEWHLRFDLRSEVDGAPHRLTSKKAIRLVIAMSYETDTGGDTFCRPQGSDREGDETLVPQRLGVPCPQLLECIGPRVRS